LRQIPRLANHTVSRSVVAVTLTVRCNNFRLLYPQAHEFDYNKISIYWSKIISTRYVRLPWIVGAEW
jgi:hypothetical protein